MEKFKEYFHRKLDESTYSDVIDYLKSIKADNDSIKLFDAIRNKINPDKCEKLKNDLMNTKNQTEVDKVLRSYE